MSEQNRIPGQYSGKASARLRTLKLFLATFLVCYLLLRFVVGISWISGHSMEPGIPNGSMVFYLRLTRDYQVGDAVPIRMPSGMFYIKRIVAMEGSEVDLKDGTLYVDGIPEQSTEALGRTDPQGDHVAYPCLLGEGEIFVLGDNREDSVDSRTYGPMVLTQIEGKILFYIPPLW